MTLDDIRKLAAGERAVADKATLGPWHRLGPDVRHYERGRSFRIANVQSWDKISENAEAIARSRASVPALCDAVDALLCVVEALPLCSCGAPATTISTAGGIYLASGVHRCDVCAAKWPTTCPVDLPYAAALRGLLAKDSQR